MLKRLPPIIWRLAKFLPPGIAYAVGLGSLVGDTVLLLETIGRKTGLPRRVPLLYDELDGVLYVATARGTHADWYANLMANPEVQVQVGSRRFRGRAELIVDPDQIVHLLKVRLRRRPLIARAILWLAGLNSSPSAAQLTEYARGRGLAALRPLEGEDQGSIDPR